MKTILAWHFLPADKKLLNGDGREVRVGKKIVHAGELKLCASGLHASIRPIDALKYISGPILCRVRCGGKIQAGTDKLVCSERTVLYWFDASVMLRAFARSCALDVAHLLWNPPDIVLRYLKTGDESIRDAAMDAARAAARNAAWDSAWAAARDSAWDAAWAAALNAAWDYARYAAMAAALNVARYAAMAAALNAAWDYARYAAMAAAWDSVRAAARDSAWDAAWAAQNKRLIQMIRAERSKL